MVHNTIVNDVESYIPSSLEKTKKKAHNQLLLTTTRYFSRCCPQGIFHYNTKRQLISGVHDVIYGTKPASECITFIDQTYQLPRYVWYMISGSFCDIIQFFIDYILHKKLNTILYIFSDSSICWMTSFAVSVVARHTSHRYLVFGDYIGGYWNSLLRMYTGYSIIIILSTCFHKLFIDFGNVSHVVAWIGTMLWTGIVNYFILKRLWTFQGK